MDNRHQTLSGEDYLFGQTFKIMIFLCGLDFSYVNFAH